MRSFIRIASISLILASPLGGARGFPDIDQKPAPGNEAEQTPLYQADYSPSVNYKLQCLGCHLSNGEGSPHNDIPRMKGFVGNYLKVEGGREFLVQIPGVSHSELNNQQLAVLLNWVLDNQSIADGSSPDQFTPYTEEEVRTYRDMTVTNLPSIREKLINRMQKRNIDIPESVVN